MGMDPKEALARKFQAEIAAIAKGYTPGAGSGSQHVTGTPEAGKTAAERPAEMPERAEGGQKIAGSSAAPRSPEAATRRRGKEIQAAFRSPPGTPSASRGESARKAQDFPPEIPESRKTKPDRKENEFMLNLMVLRNSLVINAPACRARAGLAGKWVWRDIRLMLSLVCRIQDRLLATMPASRDDYYRAYAKHGHYELRMDGPVKAGRHVLITDRHLGSICEAAMQNECIMCMREGSEIGQCPLREALMEVAPPTEVQEGLWRKCEYRGAAGDLIHGRDVTI